MKRSRPFSINTIVVLPEHLHCIWTLPEGDDDFSTRWRLIKDAFSKAIPAGEARSASRVQKRERGIWQRRFWEHVLRDENDFAIHVDYIHYNPVKHGLVDRPIDWPYSSLHRFVKQGVLPPDWGASGMAFDMDLD